MIAISLLTACQCSNSHCLDLPTGQLALDQRVVVSIVTEQLLVRSALHDRSLVQHQDQVRIANGAQAMGNDNLGTGQLA